LDGESRCWSWGETGSFFDYGSVSWQVLKEGGMARPERRYGPAGGLTLGGIIVIVGIILIFVWSFWIGLIIALVGLVFFGGFARGRWY
jgi:CHASE2 domain-containing sensor protein